MSRLTVVRASADGPGFVQLRNETVRPKDRGGLSMQGVGLLAHLLSHADGWDVSVPALAQEFKNGRDAVASAVRELERAGHLVRTKVNTQHGYSHTWRVSEDPIPVDGISGDGGFSGGGIPGGGISGGIQKDHPQKTTEKDSWPAAKGRPAAPSELDELQQLLDDYGYDRLAAADVLALLRDNQARGRNPQARHPLAFIRALADRGELDGFIASGNLDPDDDVSCVVNPVTVSTAQAARAQTGGRDR